MKAGRIAWSIVGLLSVSAARGGAVLELVPSKPGPYFGGETLTVDFWLGSDLTRDVDLVGVQLDFQDTDPRLGLDAECKLDSIFYTTAPLGLHYTMQPVLPIPTAFFTYDVLLPPGLLIVLPQGSPLHIGTIGVELPTVAGTYALDALNADETDLGRGGALVRTGAYWFAHTGEFSGGRLQFNIVPEPSVLWLLITGCGAVACVRVRRARRHPLVLWPAHARSGAVCRPDGSTLNPPTIVLCNSGDTI